MTTRKKARLGRGLGALLGDVKPVAMDDNATDNSPDKSPTKSAAGSAKSGLREIPIERLQRGKYQPRGAIDKAALAELADTIRAQGIIQPLLVRACGRDKFEIIAGERRWRAAQLAGLRAVPAVVREVSDKNAMAVALIENIQRQDLNALEEAAGIERLLTDFELTHEQAAEAVGRSRSAVTNLLRLLALNPAVKTLLSDGKIDMAHARALLPLPTNKQHAAAKQIIAGKLSVRRTERLVKQILAGATGNQTSNKKPADVIRLEANLSTRLGAKVNIQSSNNKNGKVGDSLSFAG